MRQAEPRQRKPFSPAARYNIRQAAIKRARKLWKSPQRSAQLIAQRKKAQNARNSTATR